MWNLYHLGWLTYDVTHIRDPWAKFFLAMTVLFIIRSAWPRRRSNRRSR